MDPTGNFHNPKTPFRIVKRSAAQHHTFISLQEILFRIAKNAP
jgi:hypothetical protein